jgi:hypothetical protein
MVQIHYRKLSFETLIKGHSNKTILQGLGIQGIMP